MKGTWHFFISKFKQDSLELGVILGVNLFFMFMLAFIAGPEKLDAQTFQVFLYFNCYVAIFLDLMSFGQKYYLSLPLNRQHILFNLAISKIVNFIPCFAIFTLGYSQFPKSEIFNSGYVPSMLMFIVIAFIINLYTLQYDITKPRIEHAKKKFMYLLVMIKIFINYIFFTTLLAYVGAILYSQGWHEYLNQWHLIILLVCFSVLKFFNLLKILLDEKTTYWFWKRDGIQSALKLSVVVLPLAFYSLFLGENRLYDDVPMASEIQNNQLDRIEYMLKRGDDPNSSNRFGMTPLLTAIVDGNDEAFELLIEYGGKIHSDDQISGFSKLSGLGAFDLAIRGQNEKIIRRMLELGYKYTETKEGENILHWMAATCSAPGIFDVIKAGVDIELQNKKGKTPLIRAVQKNCWPVTIALLQNGADMNAKDKDGKTALDYAQNHKNMSWFLKGVGAEAGPSRLPASRN
ncbi:MAG: ankyrin repeat domain-containing protein [Deltaproteobacteria bacterium]|nr:MAG: ankyrin repeat domain-containing protein [Deltaproteobacteria bacterium]